MHELCLKPLGQVGFLLETQELNIYIDPYLSNSVAEVEDESIKRLIDIPIKPSSINNADFVLITHEHRDHCDDKTLIPIYNNSKDCIFIGPEPVVKRLKSFGFDNSRVIEITTKLEIKSNILIEAVPSAHPEVNIGENGYPNEVGYMLNISGKKLYHAGDTSLRKEVLEKALEFSGIDVAMLPVNEINFMRNEKGIIGNMTIREAFYFANQLKVRTLIPTHWDMFEDNQVFKEEIELLYEKISTVFDLSIGESFSL